MVNKFSSGFRSDIGDDCILISSSQNFKKRSKNKAGHIRDRGRVVTDIEARIITYNVQ
jgi:hypothetical protein